MDRNIREMSAPRRAAAAGRAFLRARLVVRLGALAAAVLALPIGLALTFVHLRVVAEVFTLLTLPVAVWLAASVFRRGERCDPPGLAVGRTSEPVLWSLVDDLSRRVGVQPPAQLVVAPGTGLWVERVEEADPTLVLGAASLTWLTVGELSRLAAEPLSLLRVRHDTTVVRALRAADAVARQRIWRNQALPAGPVVRRIGIAMEVRRAALYDACREWAEGGLPPELRPGEHDAWEAETADDGWLMLQGAWAAPAAECRLGLESTALLHRELLLELEQRSVFERGWPRDNTAPATTLLGDPVSLDLAVSAWSAAQTPAVSSDLVSRTDYVDRVTVPAWREAVSDAVTAVGRAKGTIEPTCVETLIAAAAGTSAPTVAAMLLQRSDAPGFGSPDDASDLLTDVIGAAACLSLIDSGLARPTADLTRGVRLADADGDDVDVAAALLGYAADGDWAGARASLRRLGVDLERPLWVADNPVRTPAELAWAAMGGRGLRSRYLVVTDDEIATYRSGWRQWVRQATMHHTGSEAADRALGSFLGDLFAGADVGGPTESVPISDVTHARLRSGMPGSWTLVVRSPTRNLKFGGFGSHRMTAGVLGPMLGDRLDQGAMRSREVVAVCLMALCWLVMFLGGVFLLAGVLAFGREMARLGPEPSAGHQLAGVVAIFSPGLFMLLLGLIPYRVLTRRPT